MVEGSVINVPDLTGSDKLAYATVWGGYLWVETERGLFYAYDGSTETFRLEPNPTSEVRAALMGARKGWFGG